MTITLRSNKGSALTHNELDGNFSDLVANKADLLATVTQGTTAWTLTKAAHSNRAVLAGNAAAITVTFDTTGMDNGDGGRVYQTGAGGVTFVGATFAYAPHIAASPTLAGVRSWIDWRFDSGVIIFDDKSEDDTGGGGGSTVTVYTFSGTAPEDGNENTVLNAVSIGSAITTNNMMEVVAYGDYEAVAGGGVWTLKLNGTTISTFQFASDNVTSRVDSIVTAWTAAAVQKTGITGFNTQGGLVSTTVTTSGSNTLSLVCQRLSGLTRNATITLAVKVTR